MPTTSSKSHRRGHEENGRTGKLAGRSASFHGRIHAMPDEIRRLKSHPDLLSGKVPGMSPEAPARLTKLLLNVTIQRSLGAVHVVISPESTVGDLIAATVRLYAKEGRRPFLPTTDPLGFDLHYSQFSFESLNQEEKLITLGSRNFFLCPNKTIEVAVVKSSSSSSSSSSCSNQVEKASKAAAFPWFSFLDFLL